MCPHPLTTKWQVTSVRSLKIHHVCVGFFGGFILSTNHGRRFASPLTHTCPYHPVIKRGLERETALPTTILVTTIVRRRPESCSSLLHNPANVWGCYISSLRYIYIYIYIYICMIGPFSKNRDITDKYVLELRNRKKYPKWRIWEFRQCTPRGGSEVYSNKT